ncbi:MAG TPA: helicase, partial [Acidobacteria bacterium]|nr:helicase [Acidobacteriota bacterium]
MNNFITNSQTSNLSRRLSELIVSSEELKILVGFFYFSGLRELYIPLSKNPKVIIKVLVGLNVDKLNYELVEYADAEDRSGRLSNEDIQNKFLASLKKSINSDKFDHKDFYEQVRFFVELIEQNRLVIRKTLKPNHSKLYIFKLQPEQVGRKSLFITGSSNLTGWGLNAQEEFNVEISDYGIDEAEGYFDSLWEEAVAITENQKVREKLLELIKRETLVRKITPFEAYALVLKTYLDSFDKKEIGQSLVNLFKKNGYTPYQYQLDAIRQALGIIETNNGVILADVVGLGKTIIACAVGHELKKRGVIICPPGIMGDPKKKDAGWNMYKEQFGLYDWEVWSLGDLEKLQEQILSGRLQDIEVVIIDEAHRFRNQDTQSYEYLKNICRGRIVVLLTATPFNNRPADILSLLKLFIVPKKSSITLENNLVDKFTEFKTAFDRLAYIKKYHNSTDPKKRQKAFAYYLALFGEPFALAQALEKVRERSKYLAKQIRDVIEPVTIRRNRLDLLGNPYYKNEASNLSRVADPIEWFFELSKEQSDFYDVVIKDYFADPDEGGRFKGAMYRPFEYEKAKQKTLWDFLPEKENFEFIQQRNLYDFMRRLLVKRFESSFGSFAQSLKNFKHITDSVLKFIEKTDKYILDRGLIERIYDKDPEVIEEELRKYAEDLNKGVYPKNHKIYKLSDFEYRDEFLNDIKSDLDLFDSILESLDRLHLVENDPKAECLIEKIKIHFREEPEKKIAIFSEYVDTVKYLEPKLEEEFPNQVLT